VFEPVDLQFRFFLAHSIPGLIELSIFLFYLTSVRLISDFNPTAYKSSRCVPLFCVYRHRRCFKTTLSVSFCGRAYLIVEQQILWPHLLFFSPSRSFSSCFFHFRPFLTSRFSFRRPKCTSVLFDRSKPSLSSILPLSSAPPFFSMPIVLQWAPLAWLRRHVALEFSMCILSSRCLRPIVSREGRLISLRA